MAIVVEEEQKSRRSFGGLIAGAIIFVIIAVSVYYVFFKKPELVEVVTPSNFKNTQVLSQINLAPDEVINSPSFQALRSYTQPITPAPGGSTNPFLGNF